MIGKGIVFLFLAVGMVWDLKNKSIPRGYLYLWIFVAIIYATFSLINGKKIISMIIALIPGVISLFLAFVTKEQIGIGDGMIILLAGVFLHVKDVIGMIFVAFIALTLVAMVLLVTHLAGGKSKIPFIPFLFGGYIVCVLSGGFI